MTIVKAILAAIAAWACASAALAQNLPSDPEPETALGDLFTASQYPADARRLAIEGVTRFSLTVDAEGKPVSCEILASSGFDILDDTSCERMMTSSRFKPARDARGIAVEGVFTTKIRWQMDPSGDTKRVAERIEAYAISIDKAGQATACRHLMLNTDDLTEQRAKPCEAEFLSQFPEIGSRLRGSFPGQIAEIKLVSALVFSEEQRQRVVAANPDDTQGPLSIHRIQVTETGALADCAIEEQRGDVRFVQNYCPITRGQSPAFDPPFAAINKDGMATGWAIRNILLKMSD